VDFPFHVGWEGTSSSESYGSWWDEKIHIYPLVNVDITMERFTIFNGKINYFDWAIFQFVSKITRGYSSTGSSTIDISP
jgi:hypothetical protein